jgi:mannosyltransferase OCH1-like enzyme
MIPKIIHQIWIGSKKKPDIWIDTFKKDYINDNPDWDYKLWDDENILELFDEFPNNVKNI